MWSLWSNWAVCMRKISLSDRVTTSLVNKFSMKSTSGDENKSFRQKAKFCRTNKWWKPKFPKVPATCSVWTDARVASVPNSRSKSKVDSPKGTSRRSKTFSMHSSGRMLICCHSGPSLLWATLTEDSVQSLLRNQSLKRRLMTRISEPSNPRSHKNLSNWSVLQSWMKKRKTKLSNWRPKHWNSSIKKTKSRSSPFWPIKNRPPPNFWKVKLNSLSNFLPKNSRKPKESKIWNSS